MKSDETEEDLSIVVAQNKFDVTLDVPMLQFSGKSKAKGDAPALLFMYKINMNRLTRKPYMFSRCPFFSEKRAPRIDKLSFVGCISDSVMHHSFSRSQTTEGNAFPRRSASKSERSMG